MSYAPRSLNGRPVFGDKRGYVVFSQGVLPYLGERQASIETGGRIGLSEKPCLGKVLGKFNLHFTERSGFNDIHFFGFFLGVTRL